MVAARGWQRSAAGEGLCEQVGQSMPVPQPRTALQTVLRMPTHRKDVCKVGVENTCINTHKK